MIIKTIGRLMMLLFLGFSAQAQLNQYSMDHQLINSFDKNLHKIGSNTHTSIRPYKYSDFNAYGSVDSIIETLLDSNRLYLLPNSWWSKFLIWSENKVMDEHLVNIDTTNFVLKANLLMNVGLGSDFENDNNTWQNTRGIWLDGKIGDKLFFHSRVYENQALFLPYQRAYASQNFVIPGQGRFKLFELGEPLDWGFASGAVSYRPNNIFNLEMGHGKHFIGDGYRSMLLSDNSANTPYFKIETEIWKIKYMALYMQMNHIGFTDNGDRVFDQKYLAAHYLSWNATKRFNISLFEAVSWRADGNRNVDWNYLNPVIFMRPIEWQNGSADNVLLGASSKFKILDNWMVYGQLILDDLNIESLQQASGYWGNKYGYQLGTKAYDVGLEDLNLQLEYNAARPYTYTHFDSINSYTNMNQPLAHPMGANFQEVVGFARYRFKRHFLQLRHSWAQFGTDIGNVNYGGNIFYTYNTNRYDPLGDGGEFGHEIGQGMSNTLQITDLKYSYWVNPNANVFFDLGVINRQLTNSNVSDRNLYLYVAFRTALDNFYYDFF